jgi:hypothetical protein
VDEALDVLQRTASLNDPELYFQVGQGRHSEGKKPVLKGAVCACLEKDARSSLRAHENIDNVHVWHRSGRNRYPSSPRAS